MLTLMTMRMEEDESGNEVAVEYEIDVNVSFPTRPRGWDPGDPGEVEVVAVRREGVAVESWPSWVDEHARDYALEEAYERAQDAHDEEMERRGESRRQGD